MSYKKKDNVFNTKKSSNFELSIHFLRIESPKLKLFFIFDIQNDFFYVIKDKQEKIEKIRKTFNNLSSNV